MSLTNLSRSDQIWTYTIREVKGRKGEFTFDDVWNSIVAAQKEKGISFSKLERQDALACFRLLIFAHVIHTVGSGKYALVN